MHGTQNIRRLRQDATPADQTQDPFLLMQTGASGPSSITPWRWRVLVGSLVGQERMACLRVSGPRGILGTLSDSRHPRLGVRGGNSCQTLPDVAFQHRICCDP